MPGEQSNDTPSSSSNAAAPGTVSNATTSSRKCNTTNRYTPYYSLFTPPGATTSEFALIRPFAPFSPDDSLQVLRAFAVGTVGPDLLPKLTLYDVAGTPAGPFTAHLQIQSELSQAFTLEDSKGSKVLFGDMQLVPVGKGLLYVRPVYVKAEGQSAIPDLRYVVVLGNGELGRDNSLSGALNALFPGAQIVLGDRSGSTNTPSTPTTVPPVSEATAGQLLGEASSLFDEADAALKLGDLGLYQQKLAAARAKVAAAQKLIDATSPTTTPSAPTTSAVTPTSAPPSTPPPSTTVPPTTAPTA